MKPLNIIVLSNGANQLLVDTINRRGHNATLLNPSEHWIYYSDREAGYDELWNDSTGERITQKQFNACIPRIHSDRVHANKILQFINRTLGVWCAQSSNAVLTCSDKAATLHRASRAKIRIPKTALARSPKQINHLINKVGRLPVIVKPTHGSQGAGVVLLETILSANMLLESYYREKRNFLLQQYIDAGGEDIRAIVINGEVVSSMKRIAPKHDIRANLSLEGTAVPIELDDETKEFCVRAVEAIPGLGWGGVDIMVRESKDDKGNEVLERFLIEVNSAPGTKIVEVTGINHYEALLDWIERDCKKKQQETASAQLSTTPTHAKGTTQKDPEFPEINETDDEIRERLSRTYWPTGNR